MRFVLLLKFCVKLHYGYKTKSVCRKKTDMKFRKLGVVRSAIEKSVMIAILY